MTTLFNGLSGILAGVFGATITYAPRAGLVRDIQSVFRETPIEITGADGNEVLIDAPTWRVERHLAPEVGRGDIIRVPDGRQFKVETTHTTGGPAADGFILCELHEAD